MHKRDDMTIAGKNSVEINEAQTTFKGERLSIEWIGLMKSRLWRFTTVERGQGRADPDWFQNDIFAPFGVDQRGRVRSSSFSRLEQKASAHSIRYIQILLQLIREISFILQHFKMGNFEKEQLKTIKSGYQLLCFIPWKIAHHRLLKTIILMFLQWIISEIWRFFMYHLT